MACPCANRQKQSRTDPPVREDNRVPLGLSPHVSLPALFEDAYKGYDILVIAHANAPVNRGNSVNLLVVNGRNAKVAPELREAIAARFPSMFHTLEASLA